MQLWLRSWKQNSTRPLDRIRARARPSNMMSGVVTVTVSVRFCVFSTVPESVATTTNDWLPPLHRALHRARAGAVADAVHRHRCRGSCRPETDQLTGDAAALILAAVVGLTEALSATAEVAR